MPPGWQGFWGQNPAIFVSLYLFITLFTSRFCRISWFSGSKTAVVE
jgi:hypothetical protein